VILFISAARNLKRRRDDFVYRIKKPLDSFAEFAQDITRQVAGVRLSYMDAG
jgi:hypothetical protein